MHNELSRRDMLKMFALFPASIIIQPITKQFPAVSTNGQNIILMVFDAWSAKNLQLYGYKRNTMPNLAKFAERSIVYHNHHANGNFTVSGTASILTGTNPWQHRALNLGGLISNEFADKQVFNALVGTHNTIGFAQNVYADQLLGQSGSGLKKHIPFGRFNLNNQVFYDEQLFVNDSYLAFSSIENGLLRSNVGVKGSLFFNLINEIAIKIDRRKVKQRYGDNYATSVPSSIEFFDLAEMMDGLIETLKSIEQPSMVYFHCYTPHAPYSPYNKFFESFSTDNYDPVRKPDHPLIKNPTDRKEMELARTNYDAYLASWDSELIRLFTFFESSGLRDNSHIILTSDHGEQFERGHIGHGDKMMYDSILKVPLIISRPGMISREDISSKTSNIDLLPTITHLSNIQTPTWASGQLLPGLGGIDDPDRKLFTLDARLNTPHSPINEYSFSLHYKNYKMIKYQYPEYSGVELYDLEEDPEELNNLFTVLPEISKEMEKLMDDKLSEINAPSTK
jgi:arylsulfatase A-like enzyme